MCGINRPRDRSVQFRFRPHVSVQNTDLACHVVIDVLASRTAPWGIKRMRAYLQWFLYVLSFAANRGISLTSSALNILRTCIKCIRIVAKLLCCSCYLTGLVYYISHTCRQRKPANGPLKQAHFNWLHASTEYSNCLNSAAHLGSKDSTLQSNSLLMASSNEKS